MSMDLSAVLQHSTLAAANPIIRAGAAGALAAQVRWVHSSEVLDIAPLLRGGELLLTGGGGLALIGAEDRRAYIRALAGRRVAAVAIETGGALPELPGDLVEAAEEFGLPLIELRKVVPFVAVAEAINSALVSQSVVRLQRSEALSHSLAEEFANGGSLEALLTAIAVELDAGVALLNRAGNVLAAAGMDTESGDADAADRAPGAELDGRERGGGQPIDVDIPLRGIVGAQLRIVPKPGGDRELARAVGERGIDVLALALLKYQAPSLREVGGGELIRAILAGARSSRLVQLAGAAGVDPQAPACAVVGRVVGGAQRQGSVEQLLRRRSRHLVVYVDQNEFVALVALDPTEVRSSRTALLTELSAGPEDNPVIFAVGPVAYGIAAAGRSLAEARLSLEVTFALPQRGTVIDAEALAVERLTARNVAPEQIAAFVEELVGELLSHDRRKGSRLMETLETWLSLGCNTAETARVLHLERQSLHNRLQRIFALLGGDPRGTGRLAGLHMAARLAHQLPLGAAR
ncbi:PucR family transcriptional regulator ligand-binding domain-containing protein [Paenarthrobacter sp. Z7-10]|uniref:helix-turn-helix domain-containing protein n=1 Tax=Paenarthrobacter sp. Z7-10 TaxID=2787635 RepID=UPI0022A9307F|nr:PucR family transcriptional regulator [Paenarthrobacter sp. Z7-10]MCZ2404035.1 PucR family transcriptional regulator ligand-binding domain-containing protein [Paenarthrobacter sp. Z7-10]